MKITTAIFFMFICGLAQQAVAVESHCTDDETVIFNCSVGKKIVSVCASKKLSTASGYLQYRFGPKGLPELVYPEATMPPGSLVQADTLTFAGGGGAYIRFKRDHYGYVVYTAIGRGWGEKAGITVEKDNRLQVNLACKGPVLSKLGPDFFDQAGLGKDQFGFELP